MKLALLPLLLATACGACEDPPPPEAREEPARLELRWSKRLEGLFDAAAYAPDGTRVAVGRGGETQVMRVDSGDVEATRAGFPGALGFFAFVDQNHIVSGTPGRAAESWQVGADATMALELATNDDVASCEPRSFPGAPTGGVNAVGCDLSRSVPPGEGPPLHGRVGLFTWEPLGFRSVDISPADISRWPEPTELRRAVSVSSAAISSTGRIAALVALMNEMPDDNGWLIHTFALVIFDSNLEIASANPITVGTQPTTAELAWTNDGHVMLMDDAMFGVGDGRWLAVRLSEDGEIRARIPHPGYHGRLGQAYLASSDRLFVVAGRDAGLVSARTGEVEHHARLPEHLAPDLVLPSPDERHALILGFDDTALGEVTECTAQLWQLPDAED